MMGKIRGKKKHGTGKNKKEGDKEGKWGETEDEGKPRNQGEKLTTKEGWSCN